MSEPPQIRLELLTGNTIGRDLIIKGDINQIASPLPKYKPRYGLPYPPSMNFVEPEGALERLHDRLQIGSCAIAAVAGMAGVGKTELALQYAAKYGETYEGGCYWLGLRDRNLADVLAQHIKTEFQQEMPPEILEQGERAQWCWQFWERHLPENTAVLTVLDNVDEAQQIGGMLPGSSRFRLLMTTRQRCLDAAFAEEVLEELTNPKALELLTKFLGDRVGRELAAAERLCHEILGNLPLGIELAGRYLQQDTELSIAEFVQELSLLHESLDREDTRAAYPTMTAERGVRLALELSWQKLTANSQTVAKLLGLCAPHAVPWELATEMAKRAGETDETVRKARQQLASLHVMKWDAERKTATLHALVRSFLQLKVKEAETLKQIFAETMLECAQTIEPILTMKTVEILQDVVPHIQTVATQFSNLLSDDQFIWIFVGVARFYKSQGLYSAAEPWHNHCLEIAVQRLGDDHPDVAASLNNLAALYRAQGRYSEAESLFVRSLDILERQLGADHPDVAQSLNNLALLYRAQGRYSEAESLYVRSLDIREGQLGADHPDVAQSLNNLAALYRAQGRYSEAEPLFVRSLDIWEGQLGADHPNVATSLNSLALLYRAQGRYSEAEPLFVRSLDIREGQLGADHPDVAASLNNLAGLYESQGRYSEAEPLFVRSLKIMEVRLGIAHPDVATSLNDLALLYKSQGRYSEAEPLFVRSLKIMEVRLGIAHPSTMTVRSNLAALYRKMASPFS
jgi:tetratricopeptide (TPR) repeat protein